MPDHDQRPLASFDRDAGSTYIWTTRVRRTGELEATAYARSQSFSVCRQASFRESDPHPSAIEHVLGALGSDLIIGFAAHGARSGIAIEAIEATVSGRLNNPLVFLGVVGEEGHPGLEAIEATLYVSADADQSTLQQVWEETLLRSPLVNTLQRSVALSLEMKSAPG